MAQVFEVQTVNFAAGPVIRLGDRPEALDEMRLWLRLRRPGPLRVRQLSSGKEMRVRNSQRGRRLATAGVVAALVGGALAVPPASGVATNGPDNETIWEYGTVHSISDGDTIVANLTSGPGVLGDRRIRTVGVQAPEVAHNGTLAECGGSEATVKLAAQLPVGAPVQTRAVASWSNDDYSGGRIARALYAQDEEGNWYDTSRPSVSAGWLMWFPLSANSLNKPEWAHNLEYRVLAEDAASQSRGLWSAGLCGPSPYFDANLRIWAKYDSGLDRTPEKVWVANNGSAAVDLSGWTLRDSAISGYRVLPPGTVIDAGAVREVYSGDMNLNNLPADNAAFEGDAVYLLDNSGSLKTGNLRGWFPYPCNPDNCKDPLTGAVRISRIQQSEPDNRAPSAPGSVSALASAQSDATSATGGSAQITWAAPKDLGGPAVTYTVTARTPDGGTVPLEPLSGITGLSTNFPGLTVGRPYTFTVKAVNATNPALQSPESSPSGAVTPIGLPGVPGSSQTPASAPVATPIDATSVLVSWQAPANDGGKATLPYVPEITYKATSVEFPEKSCMTSAATTPASAGTTSCIVTGLIAGTSYTFTVVASNSMGSSQPSLPSNSVQPIEYEEQPPGFAPEPPVITEVRAQDKRAVVSWAAPVDNGRQITSYTVTNPDNLGNTCTATGGNTSCVVSGLNNGGTYTFVVTATNSAGTSQRSAASLPVIPYTYVDEQGPDAGSEPPSSTDPWFPGQFVEITNGPAAIAHLGGYGLWTAGSSNFLNGSRFEDRAAYLLPPDLKLQPNSTVRLHFGPPATYTLAPGVQVIEGGSSKLFDPLNDFVQLANLNRAQLDCKQWGAGQCKQSSQLSLSSSPVGITARTTSNSVTVSWGAPISRGGQAITSYTAIAFDAHIGGNVIGSCTTDGSGSSCSFPGSAGVKYYVEVVATNPSGISAPSWRVLATPKSVPAAPVGVIVTAGKGQVAIAWASGADNGAPITGFTARAYRAGTGGAPSGSCTSPVGSCTITGLERGTTYFVDVTATNRLGEGPPSSPRAAATTTGTITAVTTYSNSKVTVRWAGVPGVSAYRATVYDAPAAGQLLGSCTGGATASKCTTKKLKKNKKKLYYVDLTLVSPSGSVLLAPRIVTGVAKNPSVPTTISATAVGTRVTINWDDPLFNGYSLLKSYSARVYSKARGGSIKSSCSATATRYSCTTKATKKLKSGTTYWITAAVKNGKGWSKYASPRVPVVIP